MKFLKKYFNRKKKILDVEYSYGDLLSEYNNILDELINYGCTCQQCGNKYHNDVNVPDEIWELIKPKNKPKGSGLLCPQCIINNILFIRK